MVPRFEQHRDHLGLLRAAALRAVDPAAAVKRSVMPVDFADAAHVFVVGAGKAGTAMAHAIADILGPRLTAGVVSVPVLPVQPLPNITFIAGGHPAPAAGSVAAGRAVAGLLDKATGGDLVIALISGGGSALLELPKPGLSLTDLQVTTNALLSCGATIREINRIRARLSLLKGGGLARMAYPARVLGLVLSDVVGNELESIASGPTIPPGSSLQDTWAIVAKYDLQKILPSSVLEHLKPLRPGEGNQPPELPAIANRLIGSNRLATEAACALSEELGYKTVYLGDDWQGEARETGKRFAHRVTAGVSAGATCFIAGGETTVVVRGRGKGGRNQEVALAAAMTIEGKADTVISAFATDGVDGPTDAAGAIVTGDTIAHARRCGLDPEGHLDNNNTYPFFSCLGDLIITGPTGTNVNDLLFGLVYKANGTMQQAQPAGLHT